MLVGKIPGVELFAVHLVRDSRAVAYSWGRTRQDPQETAPRLRLGLTVSSLRWMTWNAGAELFWRRSRHYLRIRYEDLARSPRSVIGKILAFIGEPGADPFTGERIVPLRVQNHMIPGNPARFQKGELVLKPDLEWRSSMPDLHQGYVAALTWPLLLRYGYGLRGLE